MTKASTSHARLMTPIPVCAVAAVLIGYRAASPADRFTLAGAPYLGLATSAAQVLGYFVATLAGAYTFGALVHVITTAKPDEDGRLDPRSFRIHLLIERVSVAWVVLAAVMAGVTATSAAGATVIQLITQAGFLDAIAADEESCGWCATAVLAMVVAISIRFTVRWNGHVVLLIPAAAAVIAVPVTGIAGQGPDHDIATSAVIVFALALAVLVGAKAAALANPQPQTQLTRVYVLHVTAGALALVYGVILAGVMAAGTSMPDSGFGRILLAAGLALAATVIADGWTLWRRREFAVLTYSSMAAVVIAVGAVAALATQVPPRFLIQQFTRWDVVLGYRLPGPPTFANLATAWRFDPLIGVCAIAAAVGYLLGVWLLHRRGDQWPTGRTAAWLVGCAALLLATSSGIRAYGSAMFSVHMGEHMALNMFIPVLLVLGGPITLALRVLPVAADGRPPGPREWAVWFVHAPVTRFLGHPLVVFAVFVGSLYIVYFTPLFDTLVRYHWGHEFMTAHFLLTGYLYYWGIVGVDTGPKRLPFLGRLGLLFAAMPFHAFFGVATMTMTTHIGDAFYRGLGLPWVENLSSDQHLGGAIAWGSSELPILVVVVALVTQWARQDRRTAARQDRHSDSGYNDELDAYNAMLAELARQRR